MKIYGLQKTTLIDYPGKVACTVFLAGCNFRCPWCYARDLVLPELVAGRPEIPPKDFFAFLAEKQSYLEGAVVCGGEPTLNSGLPGFIKQIKDLGFAVKLDTNGSNPKMLQDLIDAKLVDYVAMDIKLPKDRYAQVLCAGCAGPTHATPAVGDIEESIRILKNSTIDFEFRTTCAPGVHSPDDLAVMARWIGQEIPGRPPKYFLQNFRPEKTLDPQFEGRRPLPPEFFAQALEKIKKFIPDCRVR